MNNKTPFAVGFALSIIGYIVLLQMGFDFGADGTLVGFGFMVAVLVSIAVVSSIIGGICSFVRSRLVHRKAMKRNKLVTKHIKNA